MAYTSERSLTAPHRDAHALQLRDDGAHRHGNRDGIEVGRVGGHGEDGHLGRGGGRPFDPDPVEASAEPQGSHEDTQADVNQPAGGHERRV